MEYAHFFGTLSQCQTSHIKALAFPESCAPHKIPNEFSALLPDVVKILETHVQKLCAIPNQVLAIFGLQPGSVAITSPAARILNRIINHENPRQHFCCSLAYLIVSEEKLTQINTWQNTQTIMIDFTTGLIMDGDYYASLVFNEPATGVIYGSLSHTKLTTIWAAINQQHCSMPTESTLLVA